jgi:hypothetical protein
MPYRYGGANRFSLYQGYRKARAFPRPSTETKEIYVVGTEKDGLSTRRDQWTNRCTNKKPKHCTYFWKWNLSLSAIDKAAQGNPKAKELASLGDSIKPASGRSMPGPLPSFHLLVPVGESMGEKPAEF